MTTDRTISFDDLTACPACDRLHRRTPLAQGELARCARCNTVLETRKPHTIERTLAASLVGIVLLVLSLKLPFLALSRNGIESHISVLDAILSLWAGNMRWLSGVTLAMIVLLPLLRFSLLAGVLTSIRLNRPPTSLQRRAFRWVVRLEPWAMADVFMVGVVISLVKLGSIARLEVGLAFWALCALIVVSVIITFTLCRDTVWQRLTR